METLNSNHSCMTGHKEITLNTVKFWQNVCQKGNEMVWTPPGHFGLHDLTFVASTRNSHEEH